MTHKRRAPRPDPAAQDPMDYLLGDVMAATDQIVAELRDMENLQADPLATLAGHCANLAGRVAALAEVVRQMRDQQRGLVVISDPEQPAFRQITEPELVAAQAGQAQRTLVRWRMGSDGLEPVFSDQDLATEQQLAARRLVRWTQSAGGQAKIQIRAANQPAADQDAITEQQVRDGLDAGTNGAGAAFLMGAMLDSDQDLAAGVDPAEVRDGLDAGTDGQQDGLGANLEDDLDAGQPARRWTRAEALAEAERLGGMGGAIFLMHWEKNGGQ